MQSKNPLTISERGSGISTASVFDCQWSPVGDLWQSKSLFLTIFGLRSSIILTFSIATNQVWIRCTLHYVTVDISAYNWIKLLLERKVYNNDDITFFSVYYCLPSPSVIMCCSPHRFAVRAATHYHTRAWQTLIYGKECFILFTVYHRNRK